MNTRRAPGRTAQPQSTAPCRPAFDRHAGAAASTPLVISGAKQASSAVRGAARDAHGARRPRAAPTTPAPPRPSAARRRRAVAPAPIAPPGSARAGPRRSPRLPARRCAAPLAHRQPHRRRQPVGEREPRPQQHEAPARPPSATSRTSGSTSTRETAERDARPEADRRGPRAAASRWLHDGRGQAQRTGRIRPSGLDARPTGARRRDGVRLGRAADGAARFGSGPRDRPARPGSARRRSRVPRVEHGRIARASAGGVGDPDQAAPGRAGSSPAGASRPARASSRSPRCRARSRPTR